MTISATTVLAPTARHAGCVGIDGRFVSTELDAKGIFMPLVTRPLSKSGTVMLAKASAVDLRELVSPYELGKLDVTIGGRFSMNQAAHILKSI